MNQHNNQGERKGFQMTFENAGGRWLCEEKTEEETGDQVVE